MNATTTQIVLIAARAAYAVLRSQTYAYQLHPSHHAKEALETAERTVRESGAVTDSHGIDGFTFGEYGGSYSEGITYLNTGDAYTLTVLFDSRDESFSVGMYGDAIEAYEAENAEEEPTAPRYGVIVGNLGDVWDGNDHTIALSTFEAYRVQSMEGYGRVAGESVTLFEDGEPLLEYAGDSPM